VWLKRSVQVLFFYPIGKILGNLEIHIGIKQARRTSFKVSATFTQLFSRAL
jgi:hypothetical protein